MNYEIMKYEIPTNFYSWVKAQTDTDRKMDCYLECNALAWQLLNRLHLPCQTEVKQRHLLLVVQKLQILYLNHRIQWHHITNKLIINYRKKTTEKMSRFYDNQLYIHPDLHDHHSHCKQYTLSVLKSNHGSILTLRLTIIDNSLHSENVQETKITNISHSHNNIIKVAYSC